MFQFFPGSFDRDHADAQLFGNRADRRKAGVTGQQALDDLRADLFKDLLIDRIPGGIGNNNIHAGLQVHFFEVGR